MTTVIKAIVIKEMSLFIFIMMEFICTTQYCSTKFSNIFEKCKCFSIYFLFCAKDTQD